MAKNDKIGANFCCNSSNHVISSQFCHSLEFDGYSTQPCILKKATALGGILTLKECKNPSLSSILKSHAFSTPRLGRRKELLRCLLTLWIAIDYVGLLWVLLKVLTSSKIIADRIIEAQGASIHHWVKNTASLYLNYEGHRQRLIGVKNLTIFQWTSNEARHEKPLKNNGENTNFFNLFGLVTKQ